MIIDEIPPYLVEGSWPNENKSLGYQTTQALFLERSMGGGVWQRRPRDGQQINDQRTEFTELSFVDCSSSTQFILQRPVLSTY